jgi:D-xylose transport system substrate-binding protein
VAQTAALEGTDVNVLYADFNALWDPATAQATAENLLTANNDDVAAIMTANDGMAGGVIQALQGRGLGGEVCVTGLDATPSALKFILEGLQTMSVWTPIDEQGRLAVDAAVALASGEELEFQTMMDNGSGAEIPAVLVPVQAITADNVCEFITTIAPEGWVSVEDVYEDPSECQG